MKFKSYSIGSLLSGCIAVVLSYASPGMCARSPADNHYFINGIVSWHLRDGFYDFGNNRVEHIELKLLRTQGVAFGKNFGLPRGIRLGLPVRLEYGKVTSDTLPILLDDGTKPSFKITSVLLLAGIEPTVQIPYRFSSKGWAYLCVGGGVHYAAMTEEEITTDGTRRKLVGDSWLEESKRGCFSVTAGHGFEAAVNSAVSLCLIYNFRFWNPVKRAAHRDLFPLESVPYTERFFTHTISAGFLFSRERE